MSPTIRLKLAASLHVALSFGLCCALAQSLKAAEAQRLLPSLSLEAPAFFTTPGGAAFAAFQYPGSGANKLISISAPAAGSSINAASVQLVVKLAAGVNRNAFSATLNGRAITGRFVYNIFRPGELIATVTAADGLRPGQNEFSVELRGPGVRAVQEIVRFTANQPQANAGADLRHPVNSRVRLDGSRSTSSDPANPAALLHQWTLLSKPSQSNVALSNANSPTPEFVADHPGTYVFQLTVTDRSSGLASQPDTVAVEVRSNLALHKVDTRVLCGGCGGNSVADYSIVVDGKAYSGQADSVSSRTGLHVVTLNRDTLEFVDHQSFGADAVASVRDYLNRLLDPAQTPQDLLVIISSFTGVGFNLSEIAGQLAKLGATNEFANITDPDFNFSFIGARGLAGTNQGIQIGNEQNLSGYFAQDSQKNYTFTQFDYVDFEINPTQDARGGTIKIGPTANYQPTIPAGAAGGFHIVVVDRANPTAPPIANNTYATNGPDGNAQLDAMNKFLAGYVTDETALVFVNSFGKPIAAQNANSRRVGQKIHMLGGTYELFTYLSFLDPNALHTYAFVGAASPPAGFGLPLYQGPEASTLLGQNGILKGVLGRGTRGNWYAPIATASLPTTDFGLYQILALPPTAFPHPANTAEQAALESIGNELCSCTDLRAGYIDTNAPITVWFSELENLTFDELEQKAGFTANDFSVVRTQVLKELKYVDAIRRFQENLASLWTDQQANFSLLVGSATAQIKNSLKPPPDTLTHSIFKSLINSLIVKAEELVSEATGIPLGLVQGVVKFTSNLAKTPEGPSATELVETKVGSLEEQAAYGFAQQLSALGTMFDVILEDWAKIEALGKALNNPTDPKWAWNGSQTTGQLLNVLNRGIEASIYESVMASVYTIREMNVIPNLGPFDPSHYCYGYLGTGCNRHFSGWPDGAWYRSQLWNENQNDNGTPTPNLAMPLLTQINPDNGKPTADLLNKLVGSAQAGGLNIYPPFILRKWSALSRNYCDPQFKTGSRCSRPAPTSCEQLGPSGLARPECLAQ